MFVRKAIMAGALLLGLAACGDQPEPTDNETTEYSARQYMQALNDIARMDDRQFDDARKPGDLLAFARIDKGDVVGDYIMGSGYLTRLLATAVGADGKVYAFQPEEFIAFRPEYAAEQDAAVAPYSDIDGKSDERFSAAWSDCGAGVARTARYHHDGDEFPRSVYRANARRHGGCGRADAV